MQPSYALLPATSYPKTVGGTCYAKIRATSIGLKDPLVINQSEAGRQNSMGLWMCYPGMQLPNHRSGKLDTLSQHAKHNQIIPAYICTIRGQGG